MIPHSPHRPKTKDDLNKQKNGGVLGEARDFVPAIEPTVAVCIGAEWVWHDFKGTVRALNDRVADGGSVVVGAARLHHRADQDQVRAQRGFIETVDDMAAIIHHHGLVPQHRIDPDDDGWDHYLDQTALAVEQWAVQHPGPRAEQWLEEQADWRRAREQDRDVIGWSVWIAHKPGQGT